jgi:hypothetical protein
MKQAWREFTLNMVAVAVAFGCYMALTYWAKLDFFYAVLGGFVALNVAIIAVRRLWR